MALFSDQTFPKETKSEFCLSEIALITYKSSIETFNIASDISNYILDVLIIQTGKSFLRLISQFNLKFKGCKTSRFSERVYPFSATSSTLHKNIAILLASTFVKLYY